MSLALDRLPFEREIAPEHLVRFWGHRELVARLIYAIEHRAVALVTGESGAGKTTALRAAVTQLDPSRYRFVYLADAELTPQAFYRQLLAELGLTPSFRAHENKRRAQEACLESYEKGRQVVLLLDEAHLLRLEMLQELRFLLNFRYDSFSPLALVLVGDRSLRQKLRLELLAPLAQRIDVRYHLSGLLPEEVPEYISSQLRRVGIDRMIYASGALELIVRHGRGLPRLINAVARTALLDAQARAQDVVDAENVERALEELTLASGLATTTEAGPGHRAPASVVLPIPINRQQADRIHRAHRHGRWPKRRHRSWSSTLRSGDRRFTNR